MSSSISEKFKVLIASDIHLGCHERHPCRSDDSFESFEEILQAAAKHDVDFILLAGDLFHQNKPSTSTVRRAMSLIRKHCFGDCPKKFEVLNWMDCNYNDPSIKIRYPIFTIHGNHDDPLGAEQISCVDLLSSSGLVEYFGKRLYQDKIVLKPVILKKGDLKIVLYGLGSMHEERLHNLMEENNFQYMTPEDDLSQYLKLLVVHQNRIQRPNTKFLDPLSLDDLPDLVIWGHEHKGYGNQPPEYIEARKFIILQPGSTVATSLCEGEAGDKFYYLMTVVMKHKPVFKIQAFRCETARPFLLRTVNIDAPLQKNKFKNLVEQHYYLSEYCASQVKEMLKSVRLEYSDDKLPLIRLRVEFTDTAHKFDLREFERKFERQVANPNEVIRFIKRRLDQGGTSLLYDDDTEQDNHIAEMIDEIDQERVLKKIHLKSIMDKYFTDAKPGQKLSLFDENYFTEKAIECVEKGVNFDVMKDFFDNTKWAMMAIHSTVDSSDDLKASIRSTKQQIEEDQQTRDEVSWLVSKPFTRQNIYTAAKNATLFGHDSSDKLDILLNDFDKEHGNPKKQSARGKGSRQTIDVIDLDNEDSDLEVKQPPARTTKRTRKLVLDPSSGESDVECITPIPTRGRGRGRPRK